jgi:predicted amidophosphoribosyltransferase
MSEVRPLLCPDCGKPLEVLAACGAKSYFCNHCNELKSSARVRAANPESERKD